MSDPRDLEPFFSYWMSALTERGLHEKGDIAMELAKQSKAIAGIAPWLAASLTEQSCAEYRAACNAVFDLDPGLPADFDMRESDVNSFRV